MRLIDDPRPDLVLTNARALTMDPRQPVAQSVAVRGDRIVWTGSDADLPALASSETRVVDCDGGTLAPGFHDAHMHLLAYASSLDAVDCRPGQVSSVTDIARLVAARATRTGPGEWVSAWGYDPFYLAERRHPTRRDLDQAAPNHPVRLNHRSGHACVLNTLAMERVGIADNTDEPPGGTIARDLVTGSPSGLLLEMEDFLDGRIPRPSASELSALIGRAARRLLSLGVTSVQDATHNNSLDRWKLIQRLSGQIQPLPRVTMMPGAGYGNDFATENLGFGSGNDRLRVGHAKLMVTASSGTLSPSFTDLKTVVNRCSSLGFPVAVHAVDADVVRKVTEAFAESPPLPGRIPPHRIEHCSEAPPDVFELIVKSGASVVTQPGFVHYQGDRYLAEVSPAMRRYLYRAASLAAQGVRVAFSSDAPVSDPDPMTVLHAAVTRQTLSGNSLGQHEALNLRTALRSYTAEPARGTGIEDRLGTLSPGRLADMVLFDEDLMSTEPDALLSVRPVMTILAGQIAWQS